MKLHTFSYLSKNAVSAFQKFPLSICCAMISSAIGIYLVEYDDSITNFFPYVNTLLTLALGIPVYFIVSIANSNFNFSTAKSVLTYLLSTLLLILVYFSLPDSALTNNTHVPYVRYTIFNIVVHLIVSFIPFIKKGKLNGFWNYNKLLFLRFLTALLYSAVLYVGLILALTSLDLLFDVDLHQELYFEIFIVIAGVFNTWFFVAGIPDNIEELDQLKIYPKGLRIFTQYVLIPLLILYLLILYVYGGKIIIEQNWPKGIVSYLISGVATLGIFTLLLVYPYGKQKNYAWIRKFTLAYYYLLIPLIAFLFYAIFIRLDDYGITINRYIIVLLGVWLSTVSIYFVMGRKNIKFIPISLAILMGLMSFGPWGMFTVSEKSQVNRLEKILAEGNILQNGKVQNEVFWKLDSNLHFQSDQKSSNQDLLNDSLKSEVYSIVNYLENNHGFKKMQGWYHQNLDSLFKVSKDSNRYFSEAKIYMESLGIQYRYYNRDKTHATWQYFGTKSNTVKEVEGYDYIISLYDYSHYNKREKIKQVKIANDYLSIELQETDSIYYIFSFRQQQFVFNLSDLKESLLERHGTSNNSDLIPNELTLQQESETIRAKLMLHTFNFNTIKDTTTLQNIQGELFIDLK